ncbi:hypothetical protein GCM10022296_01160 [Secundilactobacillus similis DSM 23365 = JCM 2765]|uniref:hypothetical protein n=1 Tax=Secundilactobacillus similis TaxID=414682 RepID=UPI0007108E94|nr:hypothetical protein [Secundilactobacillus similis]
MKLFLATMNVSIRWIDKPSASALIGIFNSREKAERARDAFAMKWARDDVPTGDCTEEYEGYQDSVTIDEVRMNETYFDRELTFEVY